MVEAYPPVSGRVGREKVVAMLKDGNLMEIAAKYAEKAEYHGFEGDYWKVWREIQRTRKLGIHESIGELDGQQRRYFARWCFEHSQDLHGIAAYRKYLDDPGGIGPFEPENTMSLDALMAAFALMRTFRSRIHGLHGANGRGLVRTLKPEIAW